MIDGFSAEAFDAEVERVRRSCPAHGEQHAERLLAERELQELNDAGFSDEDITLYVQGRPTLEDAWNFRTALFQADEAWAQPAFSSRIRSTLTSGNPSRVNPTAKDAADILISRLGRPLSNDDVPGALALFSFQVTSWARSTFRPVGSKIESGLINQFGVHLLLAADKETLCSSQRHIFESGLDEPLERVGRMMAAVFNAELPPHMKHRAIDPGFMTSKVWIYRNNVDHISRMVKALPALTVEQLSQQETAELRQHNNEFIRHLLRIRRYGIKSIAFPFDDVYPEMDTVFYDFSELDYPVRGSQPVAMVSLKSSNLEPVEKVQLNKQDVDKGPVQGFVFDGTHQMFIVDSHGELFIGGVSPDLESIPLRDLMEGEGAGAAYEQMRTAILARLFDTIAPATIVEGLQGDVPPARLTSSEETAVQDRGDIVRRMLFPRLQYLKETPRRDVRADFAAALAAEAAEAAIAQEAATPGTSQRTLHEVTAHLRKIPIGARPGDLAIKRSKKYFGEDYVLPPGYTFVKKHERGSKEVGVVVGHVATHRTVGVEFPVS